MDKVLEDRFGAKKVQMFFTDCYDLGLPHDVTAH